MLTIYTTQGCNSAKKLKEHLKHHEIPFHEESLYILLLDQTRLHEFLISHQKEFSYLFPTLEECIVDDTFIHFIQNNPSLLKRPLIFSEENNLLEFRKLANDYCNERSSNWIFCGKVRKGVK